MVVVIFLADFDQSYNKRVAKQLMRKYNQYIDAGFIHILQISKDFYPQLSNLKQNFDDKPKRVKWRAKQVVDYSVLFLYSRNISQYYLQIEDDVVCAEHFIEAIRKYVLQQRTPWVCLEFSIVGFVGKLFKSDDLHKLAQFMLLFYEEQPVDWLIIYFRQAMAQSKPRLRKPTLFQHIGLTSSLDIKGKVKARDQYFKIDQSMHHSKTNPAAHLTTSLITHGRHQLKYSYDKNQNTYFWGKYPKE